MNDQEIIDRLAKILEEEFEIDPEIIKPESTLYEELELDSLDSIDLIVALENEFGVKVDRKKDEGIIREMRTLSDVCDYVKLKTG